MDVMQMIAQLGFPITSVVFLAFFIYKVYNTGHDDIKEREQALIEANTKNSEALDKIAETIAQTNELNKELSATNKLLVDEVKGNLKDLNFSMTQVLEKLNK